MSEHSSASTARQAVVVLGMHRSGTSALAGVLARLGCALPEQIMPANDFNPKGFYESLGAYNLNDGLLRLEHADWTWWRPLALDWLDSKIGQQELDRGTTMLAQEYGDAPLFVLKDPRICILLPYWTRLFAQMEIAPFYIHTHRSPVEVARSLERREGWPLVRGLLLWLRYELEAEAQTRGQPRAFTSYDQLLQDWRGALADIQTRCGLDLPVEVTPEICEEVEGFLSADLRHSTEALVCDGSLIEQWIGGCAQVLGRWAAEGEDPEGRAALDQIRKAFDAAMPLFGAASAGQEAELAAVEAQLGQADAERLAEREHAARKYDELLQKMQAETAQLQAVMQAEKAQMEAAIEAEKTRMEAAIEAEKTRMEAAIEAEKTKAQTRLRLMQVEQQKAYEVDLSTALSGQRRHAEMRQEELRAEWQRAVAARDQAQALVVHRDEEIERLRRDLERQIIDREVLEQREQALRQSTSWRLTAPLRWVVNGLRGRA
nr:sulfotransferase family protein [Ruegeria sp. PR1b]